MQIDVDKNIQIDKIINPNTFTLFVVLKTRGKTVSIPVNILLLKNVFKMATRPKSFLDEEKITKLIEEVFEEEFHVNYQRNKTSKTGG